MTEILAYGYSCESTQQDFNEYQHDRVIKAVFQKSSHPCTLDESSHCIWGVNTKGWWNSSSAFANTYPTGCLDIAEVNVLFFFQDSQSPTFQGSKLADSLKFLQGTQRCTVWYTQHLYEAYEDAIGLPGKNHNSELCTYFVHIYCWSQRYTKAVYNHKISA